MIKKDVRKNVIIPSTNNTNLFGLLQVPSISKAPPLVICFHGLGSHKYGSKQYLVHLSKLLSTAGIASLRVDFRGSGDSEGNLSSSSLHDLLDDALNIILSALNFTEINIEKMGLFGSSLGGSLALLSLEKYSHVIKALALWAPVISGSLWLSDFLKNPTNTTKDPNSHNLSLNFQEQFLNMDTEPIIKNFPSHLKVLHMHGIKDEVVSINHQKMFLKAINEHKTSLTIKSYENATHSLGVFSKTSKVLNEIVMWFSNQLV